MKFKLLFILLFSFTVCQNLSNKNLAVIDSLNGNYLDEDLS